MRARRQSLPGPQSTPAPHRQDLGARWRRRALVNYRRAEAGARATVAEVAAEAGKVIAVEADVSKPADVSRLIDRAVEAFGAISILVNNANVRSYRALMDISHAEWRDTLAVTLDRSFFWIQARVPLMRKLGRETIVNIGGSPPIRAARAAATTRRPPRPALPA